MTNVRKILDTTAAIDHQRLAAFERLAAKKQKKPFNPTTADLQ